MICVIELCGMKAGTDDFQGGESIPDPIGMQGKKEM